MKATEAIRPGMPDELPWMTNRVPVLAVVWAVDSRREFEAVDHLNHGLWPARHRYDVAEVRPVPPGVPCPFRRDDPAVLDFEVRGGWMWVLVPQGTDLEDVVTCL